MAWFGPTNAVLHYLDIVGADRNADGEFIVEGSPPIVGMDTQEILIPADTVYRVGGQPKALAAGLASTSTGLQVKVF